MTLMMKGNKQLHVSDDRVDELRGIGYREIDKDTGAYLDTETEPEDKRKDSTVKKENTELKKQIAELAEKLAVAEKALEAASTDKAPE